MFRWHVDIKASILSAQIPGVGNVTDVNVVSRGLGGIASEVEVKGDGGSYKIKGQSQVRSMLGNTELVIKKQDGSDMTGTAALPSAFISVEKRTAEDGSIVFRVYGGGFGHGVGMSQNGAHSMAKAGKTYKDILDFSIMERRSGQNKTDVSGWQPEAETWSGKTEYGHKNTV